MLMHSTAYYEQASAHRSQASAHFLQQSCVESFLHSAAQALQRSTQSLQSASQNDDPLAANLAHKAQMSAQSRQSAIHFKWFLSFMLMQEVAQSSHSIAQARQASMHFFELFILFNYLVFLQFRCCPAFRFAVTRFIILWNPFASVHSTIHHSSLIPPTLKSKKSAITRGLLVFALVRVFSHVIVIGRNNRVSRIS